MRPSVSALTLITLVVFLVFLPFLFGRFSAIGDIRDVYIPIESFFHQQQFNGNLPAWMPNASWGFPVIASAQIGFFYPPLFILRFLPIFIYLPLIIIIHFIWMSFGTYLLLRQLEASQTASLIGALSFSLGGFVALHLTHLNIILALSWLPWQFLVCYSLSSKPITFRSVTLLSLIFGIPFLAGQLQIPTLIAGVSSFWFLFLCYKQKKSISKAVLLLILVAVGSILLASAQLFPSLELMSLSTRGADSSFDIKRANQHSYPLYHLPTLIFPRFYANDDTYWGKRLQIEYGFYVGTIPLFLAFIDLRRRRGQATERQAGLFAESNQRCLLDEKCAGTNKFFLYLLIISFLLSLGSLSPFRLIKLEPSLWVFSAPARWLLFSSFALSIFTAFGFDRLIKNIAYYRKYIISFLLFLLLLFVLTNSFLFLFDNAIMNSLTGKLSQPHLEKIYSLLDSAQSSSISFLSPYSYLPIASLLLLLFVLRMKEAKKAVLFIIIAELTILFFTTTPTIPWSDIIYPPSGINKLPDDVTSGQSRLYSVREGGDTGAYFTNPDSRANNLIRSQQRSLFVPLTNSLYNIAGIEWPASLDLANQATILETLRVEGGYAIADPILASELNIGAALNLNNEAVTINRINYKPRLSITTDEGELPLPYPTNGPPSLLSFKVDTTKNASIIMRDSFYPGWHAYIDNTTEVPIKKYLTIFRRIFIPIGQHQITFQYKPLPLYIGGFLTLTTFLVIIYAHRKIVVHALSKINK